MRDKLPVIFFANILLIGIGAVLILVKHIRKTTRRSRFFARLAKMSREYFDKCGDLVDTGDVAPAGEKAGIAEVGAAALYKLNTVMKQMKDWKEDRTNLKRNIRQLKTALRDAGRGGDSDLYSDSFLEHRRNEVKRLKDENGSLRKELDEIKVVMNEAKIDLLAESSAWRTGNFPAFLTTYEGGGELGSDSYASSIDIGGDYLRHVIETLRSRLLEVTIGDQNVEVLFVNVLGKAAEAIANLCEEVVNVTESLHSTRFSNDDLHVEIDKLRAMLRSRTGDRTNYRMRFEELGSLSKELKNHINTLKANTSSESWRSSIECSNLMIRVEQLVNNLKKRLANDREALVAAGDPDCLMYLKKVIQLRISLICLHEGLTSPQGSGDLETQRHAEQKERASKISTLAGLLREIDAEIHKFRDQNLLKHHSMNNFDSRKYLIKIEEMEAIVRHALAAIGSLKPHASLSAKPTGSRGTETLDDLVGRLCADIKELEMIVLSQDSASLFRRIEQLEELLVRSKSQLAEQEKRTSGLERNCSNVRLELEQKIKELKDTQKRIAVLAAENKSFKEKTRTMEERILGLRRECEVDRKQIKEMQQVKYEAVALQKKLCSLEADKEERLNEIKRMRAILRERENQIENIVSEHNAREKASAADLEDLLDELRSTLEQNEQLGKKIQEASTEKKDDDRKRSEELIQASKFEVQQLKMELNQSRQSLDNANSEISDLRSRLEQSESDKKILETGTIRLEAERDNLQRELKTEKATGTDRLKESTKLGIENTRLKDELARAQAETELARQRAGELQAEKEQLEKLAEDLRNKCTSLKSNVDIYKFECEAVQQELSSSKTTLQGLTSEHESSQTELNAATGRIKDLQSENALLHDNLDALALKNSEAEERLQVLLTENNDLATRINELNRANVTLEDQANKAREENERFSIEVHKLRAENDKARSELTALQNASALTKKSNVALRRTGDKLRERINEIESARCALESQIKVLRSRHEILKREKDSLSRENLTLKDYTNKFSRLGRIARTKEGQLVIISNAILREDAKLESKSAGNEIRINNRGRRLVEYEEGDDRYGYEKPEARGKIVDRKRPQAPKRLRAENEALKCEMTNLRACNSELRLELARTKSQLEHLHTELTNIKDFAESIRPVSNKLQITSLYYKQEVSALPASPDEAARNFGDSATNTVAIPSVSEARSFMDGSHAQWYMRKESEAWLRHMKRLEIQNIALIKENASLRSYVFIALADREKAENGLQDAVDESLALRVELRKLREERESLRTLVDNARMELDTMTSEKIAMRDELITARTENTALRQRAGELRTDYEKLERTNEALEGSLMNAAKVVNKYTASASNLDGLRDQLGRILQEYLAVEPAAPTAATVGVAIH